MDLQRKQNEDLDEEQQEELFLAIVLSLGTTDIVVEPVIEADNEESYSYGSPNSEKKTPFAKCLDSSFDLLVDSP